MQINALKPTWEATLTLGSLAFGPMVGVASRIAGALPLLSPRNKDLCNVGFGNSTLDAINNIGQLEIKIYSLITPVLIPAAAKFVYDIYYSEESEIQAKISEAAKKNITKGQLIVGGMITGLGILGSSGLLKPLMQAIYQPIAPANFDPSGHFLTKILTSALGLSVTKSLSEKSSSTEKTALVTWCALNAIKDTVLLTATIANHCHSIPEVVAGSLLAFAGLAGTYYFCSESESKEIPTRMKIRAEDSNQYRVTYGQESVLVDFETAEILEGALSPDILKIASAWAISYRKELQEQPDYSLCLVKKGTEA